MNKIFFYLIIIGIITGIVLVNFKNKSLPIVAIANYGPHASLESTINGIKKQMSEQGFIENKTVRYEIADVGFDSSLIPQMVSKLRSSNPKVMVVMTTPVAQFAKSKIQDIPLVYSVITDPIEAGLIKEKDKPNLNITGSSDMQDLYAFLNFAKTIIPEAKALGILYATSESNDAALVEMMRTAAAKIGISVFAVPIDQARDIPIRMQEFKDKVDFIYVGTSGPIQPALPIITQEAKKMGLPIFNVQEQAVRDGLALASFGVDYDLVGENTGRLVASLLEGAEVKGLTPTYPSTKDHRGCINKRKAVEFNITIPDDLNNVEIVG